MNAFTSSSRREKSLAKEHKLVNIDNGEGRFIVMNNCLQRFMREHKSIEFADVWSVKY